MKRLGGLPRDPWGNEYSYSYARGTDRSFEVMSPGPDGVLGNQDDVTVASTCD